MDKYKFFGESAEFKENEQEEAKKYLESWKKFLLRKLTRDSYNVIVGDEQWGERDSGSLVPTRIMYLKLYIEADWHYELGKPIR